MIFMDLSIKSNSRKCVSNRLPRLIGVLKKMVWLFAVRLIKLIVYCISQNSISYKKKYTFLLLFFKEHCVGTEILHFFRTSTEHSIFFPSIARINADVTSAISHRIQVVNLTVSFQWPNNRNSANLRKSFRKLLRIVREMNQQRSTTIILSIWM